MVAAATSSPWSSATNTDTGSGASRTTNSTISRAAWSLTISNLQSSGGHSCRYGSQRRDVPGLPGVVAEVARRAFASGGCDHVVAGAWAGRVRIPGLGRADPGLARDVRGARGGDRVLAAAGDSVAGERVDHGQRGGLHPSVAGDAPR